MASSSSPNLPVPPQPQPQPRPRADRDNNMFQNYSMNGKIIISALGVLFFIIFIIIILHMYTRWCWRNSHIRRGALSRLRSSLSVSSHRDTSKASGLDREIVEALPIFSYMSQQPLKGARSEAAPKPAECAVCLAEFQQDESCKLLPKCKHFFHVSCIDVWFLSHTTCPLCRAMPGALLMVDEEAGGILSEQGQEAQRGLRFMQSGRNGIAHGIEEHAMGDEDSLLLADISVQPRRWRRSFSDKFPYKVKEAEQSSAASVLCWDNHAHAAPHLSAVGGRSFSHISIDILKQQESRVEASVSSLVSPSWMSLHPHAHYPPNSAEKLVSK